MKKIFLVVILLSNLVTIAMAEVTGDWVTYDDKTGKKKSVIHITKQGNSISGTVVKLFPGALHKCSACKGSLKDKPIIGMTVFRNLTYKNGKWQGGKILDPKNGKWYKCELWEEGPNLKVRGYILMFYRTQTWKRH